MKRFGGEGGKMQTAMRLRAANEEKAMRTLEMQEANKEIQEEKQRMLHFTMLDTQRKLEDHEKRK
jgi:hypothetical protein